MTSEKIKTMSASEVAERLVEYQKWRRGESPYDYGLVPRQHPFTPYELGAIIDRAVELLKGEKKKKQLKRSECAILPLVLKGQWYDMIASGEKKEEYREFKQHWITRIINWREFFFVNCKDFMVIEFRLGYQKDAPRMAFECEEVWSPDRCGLWYHGSRDAFHPEWGEPKGVPYYTLQLGERVELVD